MDEACQSISPPAGTAPCSLLVCPIFGFARSGSGVGFTHPGEGQRGSRSPVAGERVSHVALRYRRLIPPATLAGLPVAAQAALTAELDSFGNLPRGGIRARNDTTFDGRASYFANWLSAYGYTDQLLAALTPQQAVATLALFVLRCSKGDNIQGRPDLQPKTIAAYLRSSAAFLELHSGVATPLFVDAAGKTWHALLAEVLTQRRNWSTPKAKKEPVTSRMFSMMAQLLDADVRRDPATHLEEFAALADWCFLGIHTGSRLGEYGQSTGGCVDPHVFSRVPFVADAGVWAGTPLAFMAADFVLYDASRRLIPHSEFLSGLGATIPASEVPAGEVDIRFRYDKSKANHTVRKFRALPGSPYCPVMRTISILRRATALGVPAAYPLGVFRSPTRSFRYINGDKMSFFLKRICIAAYPDSSHYMRSHIGSLMSHSLRVTACVALAAAGLSHEQIAFRLRWSVPSVQFYLRDSEADIGRYTNAAVLGALTI